MLRELRIRNFAVIESVTVEFGPGLNVLTGETGAGKSMLIDAILLVLGGRAQTDVIRSDADRATLEAVFDVEPRGAVVAALDEAGLAPDDGLLVARRELGRSGRHRAFVNDAAVSVGLLERLGDHLVEVHGQHEHQRLLEPARQLELLDRFADTEELRERVAGLVAKFRAARAEAERMRAAERDRAQREDLLRFQLSELDGARLRPGEEEELRQERRRRQHADKLTAGLAVVATLLDDDRDSATARLHRAARGLGDLARLDPAFAAPIEPLDAAQAQLEEGRAAVRGAARGGGRGGRGAPRLGEVRAGPTRGDRRAARRPHAPKAEVRRHRGGHAQVPRRGRRPARPPRSPRGDPRRGGAEAGRAPCRAGPGGHRALRAEAGCGGAPGSGRGARAARARNGALRIPDRGGAGGARGRVAPGARAGRVPPVEDRKSTRLNS